MLILVGNPSPRPRHGAVVVMNGYLPIDSVWPAAAGSAGFRGRGSPRRCRVLPARRRARRPGDTSHHRRPARPLV
jgi:hypothetical protein